MNSVKLYCKKKPPLAYRIPSYEPRSLIARFVIVSFVAVGILHLITYLTDIPEELSDKIPFVIYVVVILAFNIALEMQIVLDNILERFFPVPTKMRLRIFIQIIVGIIFLVIAHRAIMYFVEPKIVLNASRPGVILGMAAGLIFVQMVANTLTMSRFTQKWLNSQEELESMKREKLQMDYNLLQDQVNPHFLFNNLSVLKSLIIYDPDVAVEFTENFTDVYRYVLQSHKKRMVKLSEEYEFMKAYYALHKERLGDGILIENQITPDKMDKEIAPLTGQLLIENAIKHNITSKESPLKIVVSIVDDYLVVSNTMNLRTTSYSTKTGLKNLVKRYEMLTDRELVVQTDSKIFEVRVPLL